MTRQEGRSSSPPRRGVTTLLGENTGQDYEEFSDGLGKVRLWHFGHRISVFESSGGLVAAHASFIIDYHKRHIETHPRPYYVFGNWSMLRAYNHDVRRMLTEWQVQATYEELHVAHNSHLLAMSISMANSVLKSTVQVVPTEEALDDVFLAVRKRCGL